MNILDNISERGGHISWARHEALIGVVRARSTHELELAHGRVLRELSNKNIWVAVTEQGVMLSRGWPEAPGVALVSFPDQGTALQVLEDIGAASGSASFRAGALSYADAIESANAHHALLVMVTYDGTTPHYVPISHIPSNENSAVDQKA